jgi:hypothetical protein
MSYCRIRATGRGAFPIDMLRFLQAWPATSEDAVAIHESIWSGNNVERSIVLELDATGRHIGPHSLMRFVSFGWGAELMDRFGTHPMQGPSEPVADVAQRVREPMTPELVELRERMERREQANPHPGAADEAGQHPHCRHEWNQTPAVADESGGRIYCLLCGDDGDA